MKYFAVFLILALTACRPLPSIQPSPNLSPVEVVDIELKALQSPDVPRPNAGIWTVFQFASPGNRQVTGPYGRFIGMIKSVPNTPLLHSRSWRFGLLRQEGTRAQVPVDVTGSKGSISSWTFTLSRQSTETCQKCWLTDGVERTR